MHKNLIATMMFIFIYFLDERLPAINTIVCIIVLMRSFFSVNTDCSLSTTVCFIHLKLVPEQLDFTICIMFGHKSISID